ncbi:MAG: 50S ribosomal protein L17 [Patescibacteria group bacterium]
MRKNVFGRKFKRDTNERKALFRGLISSLILNGSITTTLDKAKAIKGDVDKIVNKAKKGEKIAFYFLQSILGRNAIRKIVSDIVPRVVGRNSGYTKLVHLGRRFSDNASMVLMEWVGEEIKSEKFPPKADQPLAEKVKNEDKKPATTEAQK